MDIKCKLFDSSKKGTIIFSHYRSGGTQLKLIIRNVLNDFYKVNCKDGGELEFDFDKIDFKNEFERKINFQWWKNNFDHLQFTDDNYGVLLINNPFSIQWIRNNHEQLNYIKENYHVIGVSRRDIIKSMLSLPLWVRFIETGLFESQLSWTDEAMLKFHNDTIDNPIDYAQIHLGYFSIFENVSKEPQNHLHQMIRHLLDEFTILKLFCQELNCDLLNYEDYEFNKEFLLDYLPKEKDIHRVVKDTYKGKIPYVSNDYSVYYDKVVRDIIKSWGFGENSCL